jgi:hypothetical protein
LRLERRSALTRLGHVRAGTELLNIAGECRGGASLLGVGPGLVTNRLMAAMSGAWFADTDLAASRGESPGSEQKARDQIVKDLATYSSADKALCMKTGVYLPSYVEWLTCLEMERDVRKMDREPQFGPGPYTLPKVNPAINEGRTVSAGVLEARANDSAQRASKPARHGKPQARSIRDGDRRVEEGEFLVQRRARRTGHGLHLRLEPAAHRPKPVAQGARDLQRVSPPLQDPASYNLDQVMEELKKAPMHPSQ